jgi:hypothetical protein
LSAKPLLWQTRSRIPRQLLLRCSTSCMAQASLSTGSRSHLLHAVVRSYTKQVHLQERLAGAFTFCCK